MPDSPRLTFGGTYTVEAGTLFELTEKSIETIRLGTRHGRHKWVVALVHLIADPDEAMDEMELGEKSLVALSGIHCLTCERPYHQRIKFAHCDGKRRD